MTTETKSMPRMPENDVPYFDTNGGYVSSGIGDGKWIHFEFADIECPACHDHDESIEHVSRMTDGAPVFQCLTCKFPFAVKVTWYEVRLVDEDKTT